MGRRSALLGALGALVGLGTASCSGTDGLPNTSASTPEPRAPANAVSRAEVERDLTLTLLRKNDEPFERERDPEFEVVLANGSRDRSYPIVLSSDGSEVGWREPHAWYTLERRVAGGPWQAAVESPSARCGLYDQDWTKDIVELAPGKHVVLPWFQFTQNWDLDDASHVRIVAHYAYGDHARDLRTVPPVLHPMPAFELGSNALELPIEEPIALEVRVQGPLPGPGQLLAPTLAVVAVNHSPRPLPFATSGTGANLSFEADVEKADGTRETLRLETSVAVGDARDTILPGARRSVVDPLTRLLDDEGVPSGAQVRRIRARLVLWTSVDERHANQRVAWSPWVGLTSR